jgi:hypothetical protein
MTIAMIIALFLQLANQSCQDSTFQKAILDKSSEPYFILITVADDSAKTSEVIATEAPFLLGALHLEYIIPYTDSGSVVVQNIALGNKDCIFHFKRKAALKSIGRFYTDQSLADVRKQLGTLSNEELLKQLKDPKSNLHKIYQGRGKGAHIPYRNAVVYLLLEKGIQVRRQSRTGNLISD